MNPTGSTSVLNTFRLNGRSAIVTGGVGLLGTQFVQTLLEAGAHVTVADADIEALNAAAAQRAANGQAVDHVVTDVRDPAAARMLVDRVLKRTARIDILVNAAALNPKFSPGHEPEGLFESLSFDEWNAAVAVNLTGVFVCCQAVVPIMRRQASGSIVNIASTYGIVGPDQRIYQRDDRPARCKPAHYSATKAGVLGLTRYLAAYLAGTGVRVNALTPGGVFAGHDAPFERAYSHRTILGRMAQPDELNGALLYLASDASSYMTGGNLIVDGGWTAW